MVEQASNACWSCIWGAREVERIFADSSPSTLERFWFPKTAVIFFNTQGPWARSECVAARRWCCVAVFRMTRQGMETWRMLSQQMGECTWQHFKEGLGLVSRKLASSGNHHICMPYNYDYPLSDNSLSFKSGVNTQLILPGKNLLPRGVFWAEIKMEVLSRGISKIWVFRHSVQHGWR